MMAPAMDVHPFFEINLYIHHIDDVVWVGKCWVKLCVIQNFWPSLALQIQVIMHFLNDLLKHGSYTGFPTIGLETQSMENPNLRPGKEGVPRAWCGG